MMDKYNSLSFFVMLNIARLLYSMFYSCCELRALPVLAQQSFMSYQYESFTLKTHFIYQPALYKCSFKSSPNYSKK